MVGARLRQLRLHHNLRQASAARAITASIAKISRMEAGIHPFRRQDLHNLLTLYGINDPYQQETVLSVALGHRDPGWWDEHDVPLAAAVLWSREQTADLVRVYQPFVIPELLRTEEYARAVYRAHHFTAPSTAAAEAHITNLRRRQQALRARGTTLWFVIDEPVLWRPVGGDLDMHLRQLDALADASKALDVTIQIVPIASPYLPAAEPFTIFRADEQLIALHRHAGDEIVELCEREHYGILWDQLAGVSTRGAATPQLLASIRDRLSPSGGAA
jgi:transcriptional regulator with XRE-family HTH domain